MPEWMHQRAEHILAKNPSMPKSEAFAIATQQSHATGHSPKGYGTASGKHKAKKKYDTPKDDEQMANPGKLESPKMAGATPPPLPAAARLPAALPKPKLYGEEGFQALMQGAKASKTNPLASILQKRAAMAFYGELNKIDVSGKEKAAMDISAMAERMKQGYEKIKQANDKSEVETKGSLDDNIGRSTVGTEHTQQAAGEQKGVPAEGYLWGQDPPADKAEVGKRNPQYETLTESGEAINAADNFDLLRKAFTNMDTAADSAKATIEQNFAGGRRGTYVTHSQTLLEKVRNIAGRV